MTTTKQQYPMTTGIETLRGLPESILRLRNDAEIELIDIKLVLSLLNNAITILTTIEFMEILREHGMIDEKEEQELTRSLLGKSPSENGYDLCGHNFVAEVKCYTPIDDSGFGSNQKKGIKRDIYNLWLGKNNVVVKDKNKFMVFLGDYNDLKFKKGIMSIVSAKYKEKDKTKDIHIKFDYFYNYTNFRNLPKDKIIMVVIHPSEITFKKLNDVVNSYQHSVP